MTTMNWRRTALVVGCLMTLALVGLADHTQARSPFFDWTYDDIEFNPPVPERFVLDNGLIVHFLPDSRLPVVTVSAIVRAGEVYVPDDKAGLAGIVGRTLVTGGTATRTPDDVDNRLEFLGIDLNGSIGDESGDFSVNCLSKDVDTALAIFSELLRTPGFDSAKFQLAVDDALEAWRRRNDSPRQIIRREFYKLIYGSHPYGRTADDKTLSSLTLADVRGFYDTYFTPGNMILAISGDLTREQLDDLLGRYFGGWEAGTFPTFPAIPAPTGGPTGVYQINKDINQTNLMFGHLGIDRKDPDRHAIRVLNYILGGGGFTSRMMMKVRSDSGWAYSVGTNFTSMNQPGVFYASCQTNSETTTKALALMEWIVEDFVANGITDEELAIAKESILNSDVFKFVTPSQIVTRYAWQEYFGFPPDQMTKDVEAIRAVTKADVEAAARKHLHPDAFTVVAVGPIEAFDAPLTKFGPVETIVVEETP
ncbi:MAG: pitrilysin family protein [Candidatus Zixiibacteriota bacterium]